MGAIAAQKRGRKPLSAVLLAEALRGFAASRKQSPKGEVLGEKARAELLAALREVPGVLPPIKFQIRPFVEDMCSNATHTRKATRVVVLGVNTGGGSSAYTALISDGQSCTEVICPPAYGKEALLATRGEFKFEHLFTFFYPPPVWFKQTYIKPAPAGP